MGIRDALGDGQANTAGACAISPKCGDDPGSCPAPGQGQLRHRHRVIPGDEDLRRNLQGHPGKVPLAQDIGQRLIALHPGQHTRQRFGDIRRGVNIPAGDDLRRRLPRRSSQQLPGAVGGVFALGRGAEPPRAVRKRSL